MRIEIILLFLLMTLLGAGGSLLLKIGGGKLKKDFRSIFFNDAILGGGSLYFLSALLNVYLLKFIPYTVFLPLTAVTYCWSMLLARIFLGEKITWEKCLGVFLIFVGITGLAIG